MTTVNLACRKGHTFEAWFRSKAEFSRQHAAGLVACPWCGVRDIERRPSVPNVMRSRDKAGTSDRKERSAAIGEADWLPSPSIQNFASALRAFHRYIERTCDDVGDRFASEARKMHDKTLEMKEAREDAEAEEWTEEWTKKRAGRDAEEGEQLSRKKHKGGGRGIYGQATAEEVRILEEDGISVSPLPPLPDRHN